MNIKVANGIKALSRKELEECFVKSLHNEHEAIYIIKKLRSWLEDEKDRLARECSQIYEDSLGKTRLVNEDIFNEVNRIISKLNELEGVNNDR